MKKIYFTASLLGLSTLIFGQNGHLPPVNFPSGQNVCDNSPWQLVFQDDFDGTSLNYPWQTFTTWKGKNDDDSPLGRVVGNCIIKDNNVEVSNGTVKLYAKREDASWHCATCQMSTVSTKYTSGYLQTTYDKPFNNGKFEARLKMPTFNWAHSTFWTWPGDQRIDEIDIAEGYGFNPIPLAGNIAAWLTGALAKCDYSVHAWDPQQGQPNPYNMGPYEVANRFPNQSWWNFLMGNYFKQDDFHIYTTEWDTGVVKFYVDNNKVSEQWKYTQWRSYRKWYNPFKDYYYLVGSGCNPSSGTWDVMQGFPYDNNSNSHLIFDLDVDKEDKTHSGTLGQMEIDYVKMWQRHPHNGWNDMCDPANSVVNGPNLICNDQIVTYTANPVSPSGYWLPTSSNLIVLSSNNSSITVKKNPSTPNGIGEVNYYPLNPSCPNATNYFLASKSMYVGVPDYASVVCAETHNKNNMQMHYNLTANIGSIPGTNLPATAYEWDIDYGPNYGAHFHGIGKSISTPDIPYIQYQTSYCKWTLKITNDCGLAIKTGEMPFTLMRKMPDSTSDQDPNNLYVVANITDDNQYSLAVDQRLSHTFIDADADDATISSIIEHIEMEELTPYLLLDSSDLGRANMARKAGNLSNSYSASQTNAYPNPTVNFVNFALSSEYKSGEVKVRVYDMLGKLKTEKQIEYTTGDLFNIDISELPVGLYNFEIQQNNYVEHIKIMKRD